jgi:hypothetical protein
VAQNSDDCVKAGGFKSIALDWQTVTSLDVGGGAAK